jgi:CheY-like chemotaxis protein
VPTVLSQSARTILIVDNNPIVRKLLRVALAKEGFFVKEAGTGEEAITIVREAAPDLVIQDLMIDGSDGIQLALEYRKLPGADKFPMIAISGLQPALVFAKAVQSGFVDYLAKPVELTKLVEVVRAHLPVRRFPN